MFFLLRPAWATVEGASGGAGRGERGGGAGEEGKEDSEEAWMVVELGFRLGEARGGRFGWKGEAVARRRRRPE